MGLFTAEVSEETSCDHGGDGEEADSIEEEESFLREQLAEAQTRVVALEAKLRDCVRRRRAKTSEAATTSNAGAAAGVSSPGGPPLRRGAKASRRATTPEEEEREGHGESETGPDATFGFVFSSPGGRASAPQADVSMETASSGSASPVKLGSDASSPFEFIFSSPGGTRGTPSGQDYQPFSHINSPASGLKDDKDDKVISLSFSLTVSRNEIDHLSLSIFVSHSPPPQVLYDFVFCSPEGKAPPPPQSSDFGDEKENEGIPDLATHFKASVDLGDSPAAKQGGLFKSKSNVDRLGEALSQRLAESLSGLFVDMQSPAEAFGGQEQQQQQQGRQQQQQNQEDQDTSSQRKRDIRQAVQGDGSADVADSAQGTSSGATSSAFDGFGDLERAQWHKGEGNKAFSQQLFQTSIQCYTDCINGCFLVTMREVDLAGTGEAAGKTKGAGEVSEAVRCQADALSNRAAAHIMLDNAEAALADCKEALRIFPGHERAQVRHATCQMYMCNFEESRRLFVECRERKLEGKGLGPDVKEKLSVVEAILDLTKVRAKAFPMSRNTAEDLVARIGKHLEYLPRSRDLVSAKCNVLLSLHRYEEVLEILAKVKTQKPLLPVPAPSQNKGLTSPGRHQQSFDSGLLWLEALACSGTGNLDKAVKIGEACCSRATEECAVHGAVKPRIDKWRKILDLKKRANEAFSAQQNKRSQELYTEALRLAVTKNVVECPPFTAILYCNRSATYQKDLDFTSALADCARSCSLDPHYVKAFSRAANICESVQVSALLLGKKRMMFAWRRRRGRASEVSGRLCGANGAELTWLSLSLSPFLCLSTLKAIRGSLGLLGGNLSEQVRPGRQAQAHQEGAQGDCPEDQGAGGAREEAKGAPGVLWVLRGGHRVAAKPLQGPRH